jgi:hypothetical protein
MEADMRLIALGFAILSIAPQIIGQEPIGQEPLHLSGATERTSINFTANSIERQDPSGTSSDVYASVFHLKGNVIIRACCMQRGLDENKPKQAVFMHGDDAVYHQETGEIEFRGGVRVTFQNYPK